MKRLLPLVFLVLLPACGTKDVTPRATGIPSTSTTATTLTPVTFEQEAKVLADCTSFQARPTEMVVFCGDGGLILDGLTWDTWAADRATGSGTAHANRCDPSCAAGNEYTGPVHVVLDKPAGGAFGELVVDWEGHNPTGSFPETFELPTTPIG